MVTDLKLNIFNLPECFISRNVQLLGASMETVGDRFIISVFLEINDRGRKLKELRAFSRELLQEKTNNLSWVGRKVKRTMEAMGEH